MDVRDGEVQNLVGPSHSVFVHCQGQQWPLALQLLSEMKDGLVAGNATWMFFWHRHILW